MEFKFLLPAKVVMGPDLRERTGEYGVWGAMEPKTNVSPTTCARCLLPRHPPR